MYFILRHKSGNNENLRGEEFFITLNFFVFFSEI